MSELQLSFFYKFKKKVKNMWSRETIVVIVIKWFKASKSETLKLSTSDKKSKRAM
jgi:hypothetical protein